MAREFTDKAYKTLENKYVDGGIADNQHAIVLPKNSSVNLANIFPDKGMLAFDTTLNEVVVMDSSGQFHPVSMGSEPPQVANSVFAGPSSGSPESPSFRTLTLADIPNIIPAVNQIVYVNYLLGDDSTGDGSYQGPYKTVAHAMTTITDAGQNKPYVIYLQAERQIETADIFMKPYTFLVGEMQRGTYIRINGGSLKPDPSHATATSWVGMSNLYWGGSSTINWDLQSLGGSNCVFIIQNCTVTGSFTYKGRNAGGGDYLENYTGIMFGPVNVDSVNSQYQSIEFIGTVSQTDTQSTSSGTSYNNAIFDGNVSITAGGTTNLRNCVYDVGVILTTSGVLTLSSYRGLPPTGRRSFSGTTTIVNLDDAIMIPYTPSIPANWAGTSPNNAQQAIDRMSSLLKTLNSNTPIP